MAHSVFLGRGRELRELRVRLSEALAGHGSVVLLRGEQGIGKSRLLKELGCLARESGSFVTEGRWYEAGHVPAYVGFRECLWPLINDDRACVETSNPYLRDISKLGPEFATTGGAVAELEDGADGSYRLGRGIELLLRESAARKPLVVLLDDLHWADEGSLDLLAFLGRDIGDAPLLIAGAFRDARGDSQDPLARSIATLRGTGNLRCIDIEGLDRDESATLAERIAQQEVDPSAAERLFELTKGNPLFLEEMVRHLLSPGVRLTASDALSLERDMPQSIHEVMARRFAEFTPECQYLLQLAACIGREFELSLLQDAGDIDVAQLIPVLQEATETSVVQETTAGRFVFAHPLMREVVYHAIPAPNRMAIHHRVATALESSHAGDPMRHAREIANHLVAAGSLADPQQVVVYGTEGGRQARALYAFAESGRLTTAALNALDRMPVPLPRLRAHLLLQLGYGGSVGGRPDQALQLYREALTIYQQLGDDEGRTDAHRWIASTLLHYGRWNETLEATTEALSQVREARTHAYAGVAGTHTLAVMVSGRLDESARWARKLLELSFDDETRAVAHHSLGAQHSWGTLDPGQALEHFSLARGLFLAQGRDATASQIALDQAVAAYFLGRFDESNQAFEEGMRLAQTAGRTGVIADLHAFQALVLAHQCAWEKAAASIDDWRSIHSEVGGNTVYQQLAQRAVALERLWKQGPDGVAPLLSSNFPLRGEPLQAVLWAAAGDERAVALLEVLKQAVPTGGRGLLWLAASLPLVSASVTVGDSEACRWTAALQRYQGGLFCWHLVDLELGRLAAMREDWSQAGHHFERAASVCEAGQLHVFRGQVALHHGVALLRAGDRRGGTSKVDDASRLLEQAGLDYLACEARALLARPARGRPLSRGPGGLSERELGVLRLLADGRSNREIAQALVLSERTVEHHLQNIYAKLSVEGRPGAIAWYLRQTIELAE